MVYDDLYSFACNVEYGIINVKREEYVSCYISWYNAKRANRETILSTLPTNERTLMI